MKRRAPKTASRPTGHVLQAAEFKASALAVMRRVSETGEPVTVTSRGKALVRIEPVLSDVARKGYGSMKGTVELLVADDSATSPEPWGTLAEWDEARKA
jgi:prevent-host-death family protein